MVEKSLKKSHLSKSRQIGHFDVFLFSNKSKSQILCDIYSNFQTLCESKPKKNEKKKNEEEEEMTGIKGMQIGKNESCSLLFVLKAATQYWR